MGLENGINIKSARSIHSKVIAPMVGNSFPGYPFASASDAEAIANAIAGGEHRVIATKYGLGLVGTAVLGLDDKAAMAEVKRVVVDPIQRKNGVASAMVEGLTVDALSLGKIPYAEVRGDKPAMQKAFLNAGFIPYGIQPAQHVVYRHLDDAGQDQGPAREHMICMIHPNLQIPLEDLYAYLNALPQTVREALINNMKASFSPPKKNPEVAKWHLPDAMTTKKNVLKSISAKKLEPNMIDITGDGDVLLLTAGDTPIIVIPPDKSAFVQLHPKNINQVIETASALGLQVVTRFSSLTTPEQIEQLALSGAQPVSIRPWQETSQDQPLWQVCMQWRLTENGFMNSQHDINLHPDVKSQLSALITDLELKVL
ncbi:MAG: hypothetical protein US11_C0007G0006 [Candidatus Roizmanbacteria bacterium GW2011_GWA2_36_23]|uniref:N-acetyltransferase domain-containing protein n=1 Tax=Candidatus Roizmanbacteria bacterium GW2011_GWA2_36_23 TaxID=1618480 RepID=A0A0G0E3M2_9BACT|nr:MAG: hypothetical protein US11_C0007G0006 [Candidatus Roizmanbacteria bacterium GW2011_GWA2_36_23]